METLRQFWHSIPSEWRVAIFGSIIATVAAGIFTDFYKLVWTGIKRLLGLSRNPKELPTTPTPPPVLPPQQLEITVKTSPQLPPPEPEKPAPPSPSPYLPPPPLVGFVPRRDTEGRYILKRLKEELAPEKKRLVALCGAGGVGKTTLAAETVRSLCDVFVNRLAWVTADGRPEFNLSTLLDEISTQLGNTELRPLPLEQKQEQVRALVAAAPTLIVLDNFETVADVEQARCSAWLSHTPCSAIITSRDEVEHARPVNISAMSLPEARILVERLIAQARHPHSFKGLEHDNIIEVADRIPLVLQWIIKQIDRAKQPDTVLQELMAGEGDAAQRVFGRSFELLNEDSRAALLALSLFAPSASRPALSQTAGFGDDLKRLDEALAQSTELWLTSTTEGNERLTIEGLTRELAKAQLSKDSRATEFRQRFVAYFLNYAEAHAKTTPEDFAALEAEKYNALNAMDAAFEMKDWDSVIRIRFALDEFLDLRGYWDEAIQRGELAMKAAHSSRDEIRIAAMSHNVAIIYQQRGELDEARRLYNESLKITKRFDNQHGIALNLHQLGILAEGEGKIEEARQLYNESLEIQKRLGNQDGIAKTTSQLGIVHYRLAEFNESKAKHEESLAIRRRLGEHQGIALDLNQLGNIARSQKEFDKARQLYNESLEIQRRIGNQHSIALILHQLGLLAEHEGNKVDAARLIREALGIFEKLKSPNAEIARRNLERLEGESS